MASLVLIKWSLLSERDTLGSMHRLGTTISRLPPVFLRDSRSPRSSYLVEESDCGVPANRLDTTKRRDRTTGSVTVTDRVTHGNSKEGWLTSISPIFLFPAWIPRRKSSLMPLRVSYRIQTHASSHYFLHASFHIVELGL